MHILDLISLLRLTPERFCLSQHLLEDKTINRLHGMGCFDD